MDREYERASRSMAASVSVRRPLCWRRCSSHEGTRNASMKWAGVLAVAVDPPPVRTRPLPWRKAPHAFHGSQEIDLVGLVDLVGYLHHDRTGDGLRVDTPT